VYCTPNPATPPVVTWKLVGAQRYDAGEE